MNYKKVKVVSALLMLVGVSFLFAGYQGVSGFAIGGGDGGFSFNFGIPIILIAITIWVLTLRLEQFDRGSLFYEEQPHKVNLKELKMQKHLRSAREMYIELYAKEPTRQELHNFIERMKKEGREIK